VRPAVEQEVRKQEALVLAEQTAEELAERWRDSDDGQGLAADFQTSLITAGEHRRGGAIGAIGPAPAVDRAIFGSEAGDVVGPVAIGDRGVVVARVNGLDLVDPAELEQQLPEVRARLSAERAQQLLRSKINQRRRDTVVEVDNALMERFAPRG
jgi:hypothetical protein